MGDIHAFTDALGRHFVVADRGAGSLAYLAANGVIVDPGRFGQVLLRELARLATQKAENLSGGSREFVQVADLLEQLGRQKALAEKAAAAGGGMADGALCAVMCDRPDVRPEAVVFTRRGETVYALSLGESEWSALPPLPPIEPAKAGAEECEPAPPALARHDWHTHRGHVSCERCGAPFSEVREDQACGAQP